MQCPAWCTQFCAQVNFFNLEHLTPGSCSFVRASTRFQSNTRCYQKNIFLLYKRAKLCHAPFHRYVRDKLRHAHFVNHVREFTHILKGLCVMSRTVSKACAWPLKCHAHFQKGLNYPGYTVSLVMDPGSFEGENCPLFLTIKYVGFITSLILWLLARISSTTGTYFHFLKQQFPLFRM